MITEDYVSFKVAKLLKEKGFDDGETHMFYSSYDPDRIFPIMEIGLVRHEDVYFAPTHQMAMKWLREVHKVLIVIDAYRANHWEGYIDSFEISIYSHASTIIVPNEIAHHRDYTEAVEAALLHVLKNLI